MDDSRRGYVICATPRSGSNYLCELLAATGVMGKPTEYFNAAALELAGLPVPEEPSLMVRQALVAGATANGVYGLKVFTHQFDLPGVDWMAGCPRLEIVYLTREDLLAQALSLTRAYQTKQWRATRPARGEESYDATLIGACLRDLIAMEARWTQFFARNGLRPVRMTYESLCADPRGALQSIAARVGVALPPALDLQVGIAIQRDASTEARRARYIAEHGGTGVLDAVP